MPSEPLSNSLCWLLARASQSLLTELYDALEELDLSPRAHEVLIAARSGEHTQVELTRMVGLDKTTLVNTLDELEAAGLAERRSSPRDRRVRIVAVTEAGRRKAAKADEVLHRVHDSVLETLPARERKVFLESLKRLVGDRLTGPAAAAGRARRR